MVIIMSFGRLNCTGSSFSDAVPVHQMTNFQMSICQITIWIGTSR
jgi:hypothetical protein